MVNQDPIHEAPSIVDTTQLGSSRGMHDQIKTSQAKTALHRICSQIVIFIISCRVGDGLHWMLTEQGQQQFVSRRQVRVMSAKIERGDGEPEKQARTCICF